MCANIIGETLDWLGGVVRRCFPCLSEPCKYVIAVKQLSRSLVFCFCPKEHSFKKQIQTWKAKKKWWECLLAKTVRLSHNPIYARNGVFCGWARLVGRGTARVMSGPHQRIASECRVYEGVFPSHGLACGNCVSHPGAPKSSTNVAKGTGRTQMGQCACYCLRRF